MKQYLYSEARAGVCKGGGGLPKHVYPLRNLAQKCHLEAVLTKCLKVGVVGRFRPIAPPPPQYSPVFFNEDI